MSSARTELPVERVTFYREITRRRHQARLLSLACLAIASGLGIVMSCLVTPLVLLAGGGLLRLAAWIGIFPGTARGLVRAIGGWVMACSRLFEVVLSDLDRVHHWRDVGLLLPPLAGLAPFCLPALIASALLWLVFRGISLRSEDGDLLSRLGARPPLTTDPEEHQATNIAAEIAIAAGITPPRLLMVDATEPNAASIGTDRDHATLIVSRGLLDELSRDETSGVMAHLVASVAQGDMRLTHGILAVFQTIGFYFTLLDIPFRWSAWRALGGLALVTLGASRSPGHVARTLDAIESSVGAEAMPDVDRVWSVIPYVWLRKTLMVPLLPLLLISVIVRAVLFLWMALFLGPPLAWIWRIRRHAADATAVQLTRDPDALARALARIGGSGIPSGAEGREHCFIQGPPQASGLFAARRSMMASLHPVLAKRLRRLVAQGAEARWAERRRGLDWAELRARPAVLLLACFLVLLLMSLGVALVVLAVGFLTLVAMTLSLAAGLTLVSAVLP